MADSEIRWTRREALACAYCWSEFLEPEKREDTPEQYWRQVTERTRQECRKIVKDRNLLAVAMRQAAPVFPPGNLSEKQLDAVRDALGLKARHRVWAILDAVYQVFLPTEYGETAEANPLVPRVATPEGLQCMEKRVRPVKGPGKEKRRDAGEAYKEAVADRGAEIAGAKEVIEARVRLAQIGVVRNKRGVK